MDKDVNDLELIDYSNKKLAVFLGEKTYFSHKDVALLFKTSSNIVMDWVCSKKLEHTSPKFIGNLMYIKREDLIQFIILNGYQQFVLEIRYSFLIKELSQMLGKDRRWFHNKIKKGEIIPLKSPGNKCYISLLESIKVVDMLFASYSKEAREKYDLLNTACRVKRYYQNPNPSGVGGSLNIEKSEKEDLLEVQQDFALSKIVKPLKDQRLKFEGTPKPDTVYMGRNKIPKITNPEDVVIKPYISGCIDSNPETISSIMEGINEKVLDNVSTQLREFPINSLLEPDQRVFIRILKGLEAELIKFKDKCKDN